MKYGKTKTKSLLCAVAIAGATLNMTSCMNKNPFFSEYNTPHETAPFNKIKLDGIFTARVAYQKNLVFCTFRGV